MHLIRTCLLSALALSAAACAPEANIAKAPGSSAQEICTTGQDQTCNGDATISAVWGTCLAGGTASR